MSRLTALEAAIQAYLDTMYDGDLARFDQVFHPTAQLHGWREGKAICWPLAQYRELTAGRPSAKASGAQREEAILSLDLASDRSAIAKVRVRMGKMVFVDYLIFALLDGRWQITAKQFEPDA
ncbi:putative lumazine-binding protein [Stella humosa]|uniref:Putative lumazine-binding protein n=1 Tax=Stella humosa TaxID=94 RepID=A0A3N1KUN3_9PROT|nr:nuclear transport factor 2 family protein [Stella humosa]ROP84291.1 putative lumazine-binding protein [Stella humosa]BBK33804.1 hypothetical protein STHU_44380 [Stella humosa]